jgi:hypothetical protein
MSGTKLASLIAAEDYDGVVALAQQKASRVLRYLNSRLYTEDPQEKARVVTALGQVMRDRELIREKRVTDTLRRFFWSLNDESGAVPYGTPEAIGEILAVRREYQGEFLPLLCSLLTHEDMVQTGPIEQGVIWALGRVGPPVAACSRDAVKGLHHHARWHTDDETRRLAAEALVMVEGASTDSSAESSAEEAEGDAAR